MSTPSLGPTPPSPPPRGWFARNWWKLLLAIILGSILVCGGLCAGIMGFSMRAVKQLEPYQMALKQTQKDPKVIERLGQPVEDATWFPSGNFQITNDRGDANFTFKVAGPKGTADVHAQSRLTAGKWELVQLEATFADGQRVPLDTGAATNDAPPFNPKGGGDAPKWKPSMAVPAPKDDDNEIRIDLPK